MKPIPNPDNAKIELETVNQFTANDVSNFGTSQEHDPPVHKPLEGFLGGLQKQKRTDVGQELLDKLVQLIVDLTRLHGALHGFGALREQGVLVLDQRRIQLQQIVESIQTCTTFKLLSSANAKLMEHSTCANMR